MTNESESVYTVVVGVSQTSKSPKALAWGAAQAAATGGRLIAVRVWRAPMTAGTTSGVGAARASDTGSLERDEQQRFEEDVREVLGDDHGAELRLVRGNSRRALIAEAGDADLLVIDAPRGPSMSPLLAHRIVYSASCPVVVMPPSVSEEPPTALARAGRAIGEAAIRSAGTAGRPGYRPPPRTRT